jgi:hypothetical protein
MSAMEGVEVPRLVRGMNRHTGKARLLEIEDARPGKLLDESQEILTKRL